MSEPNIDIRIIETQDDVDDILEIIEDHDEDDAEYAADYYKKWLHDQSDWHQDLVLTLDDEIIAVTGYSYDEFTDGTFWLAWTYTDYDYHGQGHGSMLVGFVFEQLEKLEGEGRKIYVSTSDYVDWEDGKLYEKAINFYESLGFSTEITLRDYYAPSESQIIMSRGLNRYNSNHGERAQPETDKSFMFTNFELASETEDVYYINWELAKTGNDDKILNKMLSIETKLRRKKARKAYITCASIDQNIINFLKSNGYREYGRLRDYFENGIDEVHFFYDLQ